VHEPARYRVIAVYTGERDLPQIADRIKDRLNKDGVSLTANGALGVEFVREPKVETYGTVAVFKDLYGNLCDLIGKMIL
jgi:hypothetical protein